MKKLTHIYQEPNHSWAVAHRDPERPDYIIDTNEYIISIDDETIITDPGGMEVFPSVFTAITGDYNPEEIKAIFASHQDPDIISSLSLWLEINPRMKCYISWLWGNFIPHFGGNKSTFKLIPDEGMEIRLGGKRLQAIPAHHLHSAGNFHLYDPQARILFSGDVGAALLHTIDIYVRDFDKHIQYAKKFHQRWMGSKECKLNWCERVSQMEINMLAPQHGCIYRGKDVERFINWFAELPIGIAECHSDMAKAQEEETDEEEPEIEIIEEETELADKPANGDANGESDDIEIDDEIEFVD